MKRNQSSVELFASVVSGVRIADFAKVFAEYPDARFGNSMDRAVHVELGIAIEGLEPYTREELEASEVKRALQRMRIAVPPEVDLLMQSGAAKEVRNREHSRRAREASLALTRPLEEAILALAPVKS